MKTWYKLILAVHVLLVPQLGWSAVNHVTNLNDSGPGSLRAVIAASAAGDTIDFPGIAGTVVLTGGQLSIGVDLTIVGPGQGDLVLLGRPDFTTLGTRIFNISAVNASLSGMTIANGYTNDAPGGAIYNAGTLTISDCTLMNNVVSEASGGQVLGGAIYNLGGTLLVNRCSFRTNGVGNAASHGSSALGGAIYNDGGTVSLRSSTFSDNKALGYQNIPVFGGALYNNAGTLSINNCTLAGNSAASMTFQSVASGGAIYNAGALSISNSTLAGNSSLSAPSQMGGGIYQSAGTLNMQNTIVAGNTASSSGPDIQGAITSRGFNLIGKTNGSSGWVSSDLKGSTSIPLNPSLGPLADNGGPTFTMALQVGSVAIDAGFSGGAGTDQRGVPRPSDNPVFPNAPGGDGSDIGAYEVGLHLNTAVAGAGVVLKTPDLVAYAYNQAVTLQAIANPGWTFTGWSGSASGSANPLQLVMNSDKTVTATFSPTPCTGAPLPQGLISWWRGEGDYFDFTGNNTGGYVIGFGAGLSYAPGKVGQAFSFVATNDAKVVGLGNPNLSPSNAITIEAWVQPTSYPNPTPTVVRKDYTAGTPQYWLALTDAGHASCTIGGFASVIAGFVPIGQWSHLACTYDLQTLRVYVNGTEVGSTAAAQAIPGPAGSSLYIGAEGSSNDKNFDGLIDEVAIYDRALTAAEIQAIYDAGSAGKCLPACTPAPSGLVAWWPAAGNANDIIGNNNGTLQGGATYSQGRVGQAFGFDGVAGYVAVSNTASMDVGSSDFTLDLWVKLNSLATDQTLLHKSVGIGPNDRHYMLEFDLPNALRFFVRDTTTNQNDLAVPTSLVAGQWYHVAGVRTGITNSLYLDGVLIGSQAGALVVNTGSGGACTIGKLAPNGSGVNRFLNGYLDEIELFNRALSPSEIQAIYNASVAGKCQTPLYITSFNKSSTNVSLSWLAQRGVGYRAQYNTNLGASPWLDVAGDVTATSATAAKGDTVPVDAPQRLYRVEMLR